MDPARKSSVRHQLWDAVVLNRRAASINFHRDQMEDALQNAAHSRTQIAFYMGQPGFTDARLAEEARLERYNQRAVEMQNKLTRGVLDILDQ